MTGKNENILNLDSNSCEIVGYVDPLFPLEIWTGSFGKLSGTGLPLHWHPEYEYGVILRGEMIYAFQDCSLELGPGDCVFVNSESMHYIRQKNVDETAELYTVAFPPALLCESRQGFIYKKYIAPMEALNFQGLKIDDSGTYGTRIHRLLQEIYDSRNMRYGFELHALGLVYQLWLQTLNYVNAADLPANGGRSTAAEKNSAAIKRALTFIYEHYDEKLTAEDIASAAYISRNSLFRYFRGGFGKSPLEVLNEHRLSVATALLLTDRPITEIALACGFGSSSYFSRIFRESSGMTPQRYRELRKAEAGGDK